VGLGAAAAVGDIELLVTGADAGDEVAVRSTRTLDVTV
jgi:hypothetical protein